MFLEIQLPYQCIFSLFEKCSLTLYLTKFLTKAYLLKFTYQHSLLYLHYTYHNDDRLPYKYQDICIYLKYTNNRLSSHSLMISSFKTFKALHKCHLCCEACPSRYVKLNITSPFVSQN